MSILFNIKQNSSTLHAEEFKALAEKLCRMLRAEGVHCRPYVEGLPYFSKLAKEKQAEAVRNLGFYVELCRDQLLNGYRLSDNLTFTWRAFRKLRLIPRADLFQNVTDEDVLEVYSSDNRQLYRNLRFYEHCSYSLEELYSIEWWTLFHREEKYTTALMADAMKVFSGEVEGHICPQMGTHLVKELISEAKLSHWYEPRLLSPLTFNKKVEGIFAVFRLQPVQN